MKYLLFLGLALSFIFSGCAVFKSGSAGGDEIYEGAGQGYLGPVTVRVLMNGNQIIDIVIIDYGGDLSTGNAAMEELAELVIMYNSTDIDAAAESGRGFLEAVENAIMRR